MNRPFFRSKRDVRETIFSQKNILPRNVFCFFSSRKEIVPLSFLSRKKKRSACAGSAAPQTDGRRHILRCRRSKYRSGYASLLRLVSARVRRACAPAFPCKLTTQKKVDFRRVFFAAFSVSANLQRKTDGSYVNRLLFFLEEKKQKKINGGRAASLRSSRSRQPVTQNGRFVCEPSVFFFQTGRAGKRLFPDKSTIPLCLLFLFFKKRNRSLFFSF